MSKEFVAVVTEGMSEAAYAVADHTSIVAIESAVAKALAHPDFAKQVRAYAAAVARGLVPGIRAARTRDEYDEGFADGHNACRERVEESIDRWEKGE